MPKYRLKHPCQIDGAVYPAGHVIERPEGWVGPMRTVTQGSEMLSIDEKSKTILPKMVDEPLYERIEE